jgi:hypothetical protein
MHDSIERITIGEFYGARTSERSKVPLINHIDEGLVILDIIRSCEDTKRAWCIHPMVQNDDDLKKNYRKLSKISSGRTMMFAMDYRSVANEYLSEKVNTGHKIRLSPIDEVNDMLCADKIQNRKDFLIYHSATHERRIELNQYFNDWMGALDISENIYQNCVRRIIQVNSRA